MSDDLDFIVIDDIPEYVFCIPDDEELENVIPVKGEDGSFKYEKVAELPETGEDGVLYLVPKDLDTVTETGQSLIIENYSSRDYPVVDFALMRNSIQDDPPSPNIPVPVPVVTGENTINIAGKNKANAQTFINWVNSTYSLCVNYEWGTDLRRPFYGAYAGRQHVVRFAADTLYSVHEQMTDPTYDDAMTIYEGIFKEKTQYTISFDMHSKNNASTNLRIVYTDGTWTNLGLAPTEKGWRRCKQTTAAGKTVKLIRLTYSSGYTYLDLDTFQIEEGQNVTSYQPYYAEQSFLINLTKNLINPDLMASGYIQANGIPTTSGATGDMCTPYIKVEPNTQYTFEIFETSSSYVNWIGYCEFTDQDVASIIGARYVEQSGASYYTFTTSATAKYIRLSARNLQAATKYQLTKGGRTTYSPYIGLVGKPDAEYSDKIYKIGNKWYWHKAMRGRQLISSSNANWRASGTTAGVFFYPIDDSIVPIGNIEIMHDGLSDRFMDGYSYSDLLLSTTPTGAMTLTYDPAIALKNTDYSTITTIANWARDAGLTVYYPLATAVNIEITDETLIAQLDAFYGALVHKGTNIITVGANSGNATPIISVTYNTGDPDDLCDEYLWNNDRFELISEPHLSISNSEIDSIIKES